VSETESSYKAQVELLLRATRQPDLFRFILVQYDRYVVINGLENLLHIEYPERPILRLRVQHQDYKSLIEKLTNHRGFVIIEDFNRLLDDPAIYHGFNQRRDRITALPIQLICFMPEGADYLRDCMEKIRDWWSVRSLLLNFKSEQALETKEGILEVSLDSSLGGYDAVGKREELKRILERLEELGESTSATELKQSLYPQALNILKDLGEYQRGLDLALRWYKEAEVAGWSGYDRGELYNQLGIFSGQLGNYNKAIQYFKDALPIIEKEKSGHGLSIIQSNLGDAYGNLGRYDEAAELLEHALKNCLDKLGEAHPDVAAIRSNLASIYYKIGRHEEATHLLEAALASDLANLGERHPNVAIRRSNLATIYGYLGRYAEAASLLEEVLASDLTNFGESHPSVANSRSNLSFIYWDMGRHAEATALTEEALASDLANFGESHPNVAIRYNNLAFAYRESSQYQQALNYFQKALTILKNTFGEKHPNIDAVNKNILDTIHQGAAAGDPHMLALQKKLNNKTNEETP
jgi:tetratricopeptide (TPR) repeat protein